MAYKNIEQMEADILFILTELKRDIDAGIEGLKTVGLELTYDPDLEAIGPGKGELQVGRFLIKIKKDLDANRR